MKAKNIVFLSLLALGIYSAQAQDIQGEPDNTTERGKGEERDIDDW